MNPLHPFSSNNTHYYNDTEERHGQAGPSGLNGKSPPPSPHTRSATAAGDADPAKRLADHLRPLGLSSDSSSPSASLPSASASASTNNVVPSTFLPSYYPESHAAPTSVLPSYASSPSTVSFASASASVRDPSAPSRPLSSRPHLLDGVDIPSPPAQPPHTAEATYDLTPIDKESVLPPPMTKRWPPQRDTMFWRNNDFSDDADHLAASPAGPSRSRQSQHQQQQLQQQQQGQPGMPGSRYLDNPYHPHNERMPGGPPLSADHLPPPGSSRSYPYIGYENLPRSAGYPGTMLDGVPVPEGMMPSPTVGFPDLDYRPADADDFAHALAVYEHLMAALPHIRPAGAPPTHDSAHQYEGLLALAADAAGLLSGAAPGRSPFDTLERPPSPRNKVLGKRANMQNHGHGHGHGGGGPGGGGTGPDRKVGGTKCLGCGATETPEWRRGPLGPRTLCNACGLVHMKMLRKQRKEAEKLKGPGP